MGQTHSQSDSQRASRQIANFYHICNIIPDTPEHHHQIWSPDGSNATSEAPEEPPLPQPSQHTKHCRRSAPHRQVQTQHIHGHHQSHNSEQFATPGSIDDDVYCAHPPVRTNAFPSSNRMTASASASASASATDRTTDDESDVFSSHHHNRRRSARSKRRSCVPSQPVSAPTHADSFPELLDRRYDLDVAPSMINMDLRFNGAYMVVNSIYNILTCKFGYQHMLSVQMLFWMAIHKYYQIQSIDTHANYKLSLSTLLDIVKHMSLCSERDVSIYTDVAKQYNTNHHPASQQQYATTSSRSTSTPAPATNTHTFPITALVQKPMYQRPFYQMQYYYVPKEEHCIKQALLNDHLILANLTLFSNFLSSRGGLVRFPNSTDTSAGMIVVTIIGYRADTWIVRFPFGIHWGDQGVGYVSFEYFDRYNRDRWLIDISECAEPPQYVTQRQKEQLTENSELLAAHMETSPHTHPHHVSNTVRVPDGSKTSHTSYRARRRIV